MIRPTGLVDPEIVVKPTKGQIDDLIGEIRERSAKNERVLVTTLTKKMSEDLTDYLLELGIRVRYLHSEVDTLRRVELLRELRMGEFDVLVGINLLREGLDLPEVSLVAILDADKEGFLRSETSLIQTIGRAARNVNGQVHMYADKITPSMARAIDETTRRRQKQRDYNTGQRHRPDTAAEEDQRHPGAGVRRGRGRGRRRDTDPAGWIRAELLPRPEGDGRAGRFELGCVRRAQHGGDGPQRAGRPGAAADRPDDERRPRSAVRAGRPAAGRDPGTEEGDPGHGLRRGGRRGPLMTPQQARQSALHNVQPATAERPGSCWETGPFGNGLAVQAA